jgi:hypothetical protein
MFFQKLRGVIQLRANQATGCIFKYLPPGWPSSRGIEKKVKVSLNNLNLNISIGSQKQNQYLPPILFVKVCISNYKVPSTNIWLLMLLLIPMLLRKILGSEQVLTRYGERLGD